MPAASKTAKAKSKTHPAASTPKAEKPAAPAPDAVTPQTWLRPELDDTTAVPVE